MTKKNELEVLKARYAELLKFAQLVFGALVAHNPNWKSYQDKLDKFADYAAPAEEPAEKEEVE